MGDYGMVVQACNPALQSTGEEDQFKSILGQTANVRTA